MNVGRQPAGPELRIRAIATRGDRSAFTALFERFAPRTKAYLVQFGLDVGSAEEPAQEVLLLVWRKAAQYDPTRASAVAWIFTIARNLRIDVARRARLAMAIPDALDEPAPTQPADAILAAEDRGIRVCAALVSLPAEQIDVGSPVVLRRSSTCRHRARGGQSSRHGEIPAAPRYVAIARATGRRFMIRPDRLFLIGHSAGGQIAVLLGLDGSYLQADGMSPSEVCGVIGLAGPLTFLAPAREATLRFIAAHSACGV